MKKSIVFFLFTLLILNIFLISIKAELLPSLPTTGTGDSALPSELEKIQQISENLTDEEKRSQYLNQEWGEILKKNEFFGPILEKYKKVSPYTDPVFKYTIGIEPTLSWLFILTLTLWIAFLIYTFRIFELVTPFSSTVQYLISIGVVVIVSITGAIKILAQKIIDLLSLLNVWWIQLIGIAAFIIALIIATIFSKNIKDIGKSIEEKKKKNEEERNREKLKSEIKIAGIINKSTAD
jgi:hypothetical protein